MAELNLGNPRGFNIQLGYDRVAWPHVGLSLWLGWFDPFFAQIALGWWWFRVRVSRAPHADSKGPRR